MTKKILFTGPESTGKSTLAKQLALQYNTEWVPEYARFFLEKTAGEYAEVDLLMIAQGQLALEEQAIISARQFLFCDTGLLVMKVWSEYKYGQCHPWIKKHWTQSHYDYIFLCETDVPWEPDTFRKNPNEREELYAIYLAELESSGKDFIILRGNLKERIELVKEYLK